MLQLNIFREGVGQLQSIVTSNGHWCNVSGSKIKIYTCMCRIFEAFDCESSIAEFVYLWMIYGQKRHV